MAEQLTIGPTAVLVGIQENHLRKLCDRRAVPFRKVGQYRVFAAKDVEKIRKAAREAGYLREPDPAPAAPCPV